MSHLAMTLLRRSRAIRAAAASAPPSPPCSVRDNAPELRLVRAWLDNWSGLGLIIAGMSHQSFTVSLGEHGAGRWIAVFFHGRGGHEPVAAAGTAQESTPWRAVRRAPEPGCSVYAAAEASDPLARHPLRQEGDTR